MQSRLNGRSVLNAHKAKESRRKKNYRTLYLNGFDATRSAASNWMMFGWRQTLLTKLYEKEEEKISAIEYIVEMRHSADNSLRNRAALLWHFSFYLPFFALFRPIKWNEFEIMLSICIQENGKKN